MNFVFDCFQLLFKIDLAIDIYIRLSALMHIKHNNKVTHKSKSLCYDTCVDL